MRHYTAEKFFRFTDFPLSCDLAPQHDSMEPHTHDFTEIVFIAKGTTSHTFGNSNPARLIRGDIFSVLPGEVHSYNLSSNFEIYNLALDLDMLGENLEPLLCIDGCRMLLDPEKRLAGQKFYLLPRQRQEITGLLHQMYINGQPSNPVRRLEQRTLLLRFFLALQRVDLPLEKPWEAVNKNNFLKALDRIEQNPAGNDSLNDLARIAGMSVSGFTSHFRKEMGISVGDFRQILRLDHANSLLLNTFMSMEEIAMAAGFYDSNYFIKIYRKHYGVSPARHRREFTAGKKILR